MPIGSAQRYIQSLLQGLEFPMVGVPALNAQITPPDPNVEATTPQAYIWPSRGTENRNPRKGGTINRAPFPDAPSGLKAQDHRLGVYLVYWMADDDPDADSLFPGMVDIIMAELRTSRDPSPLLTDVWIGTESYLIDVGEEMDYEITLRAVVEQAYNRYDALITLTLNEVFPS